VRIEAPDVSDALREVRAEMRLQDPALLED
jgi:hypothetical protein